MVCCCQLSAHIAGNCAGGVINHFYHAASPVFLDEQVGRRRMLAVIIGFSGVLFLINPFGQETESLGPIGLIAGFAMPFFAAIMFIFLRRLGRSEAAISTTLWYNGVGTILCAFLLLITGAAFPPVIPDNGFIWFVLIFAGVGSSFQQFLMAWSHELAPASALARCITALYPYPFLSALSFLKKK